MRRVAYLFLLAGCLAAAAAAQASNGNPNATVFPPSSQPYGADMATWGERASQWVYAPAAARTFALAAHPGNVPTALWRTSSSLERALISPRLRVLNFWLAQSPQLGALPTLRAAVDSAARGGEYYGPGGAFQFTGNPTRVHSSAHSRDTVDRRRLWEISERLTRVSYGLPEPSRPAGHDVERD